MRRPSRDAIWEAVVLLLLASILLFVAWWRVDHPVTPAPKMIDWYEKGEAMMPPLGAY